jgi:cytochrome c553
MALAFFTLVPARPLVAQAGRVARPQVTRPDGAAWEVIRKNCTRCHGIDDYAFYALNKSGWQQLIATKHQNRKVTVAAGDENILVEWLVSKFGPESKPFPRAYKSAEITTFFSDEEANDLIERSCGNCHSRDTVDKARFAEDGWRKVSLDMRERGAKITDDEIEHLVEWLGRVRGTNRDK